VSRTSCTSQVSSLAALMTLSWCLGLSAANPDDQLIVDPTLPLFPRGGTTSPATDASNAPGAQTEGYRLHSILTRGGARVAVINSQRVQVGDAVGSAIVTAINEDSVTLDVAGRLQILNLYRTTIRTPAGR
jgi:MSHA biogenesis protein MshK